MMGELKDENGRPIVPLETNIGEMKRWLTDSDYCDMVVFELDGERHRCGVDIDERFMGARFALDDEHFEEPEQLAAAALFDRPDDTKVTLLGQESDRAVQDHSLRYIPWKDVRRGALLVTDMEYFHNLKADS